MSNEVPKMVVKTEIAKPLHHQQLERSLNIDSFLTYVEDFLKEPDGEDDASSDSDTELAGVDEYTGETIWNGVTTTKNDRISDKLRLYNVSNITPDRLWLQDILLSDTSDSSDDEITEDDFKAMLKQHVLMKKYQNKFYRNPKYRQFQYYSAGLLSNHDKFPEHQILTAGFSKKKKSHKKEKVKIENHEVVNFEPKVPKNVEEEIKQLPKVKKSAVHKKKATQTKAAEIMLHRRRKIWSNMAKKEIGKVHRSKMNNHKEVLTSCKRIANSCMKYMRHKAMTSQKNMKDIIWRAKRLTREMQLHWKRFERSEREARRKMEKEAEEQRKQDVELMEAKRQQRKLNFLITQTELYAHFMSRKLGGGSAEEQLRILNQLDEDANPRLAAIDDYDCEAEKDKVRLKVEKACSVEEGRAKEFGLLIENSDVKIKTEVSEDKPQPTIFRGSLKGYQIKGMTWLVNLYDQGINGILADEMGLGKTVQSIAFLCHIAEKYSVWGPFLIISPSSTLHNWQQEMARFVPDFKVVPYWGNQQERKTLRQFWDRKDINTKEASFHVVITSYQLVITDFKYFNRIKWQYLILDEAQAIKSTQSMRWKLLLGFNCRNRLLLSGTPIQNSMAELWALLHFIMPSMFDSHDEFNEWFSKDIESHAEHKTSIDEKHLSRLHMILKPFMLRRVKADVENELSDKIEIMVYCPLTTRQKLLYSGLKKKIKIEDLLHSSGSYQSAQTITSNLMNLVMQFRKVCNHPELFERREPWAPLTHSCEDYVVPKLITEEGLLQKRNLSIKHILYNKFSILMPEYVHQEIQNGNNFGFMHIVGLSPHELFQITLGGLLNRLLHISSRIKDSFKWKQKRCFYGVNNHVPENFVFVSQNNNFYCHKTVLIHSVPETLEHRLLRSKKIMPPGDSNETPKLPEFIHIPRKPQILECEPVSFPAFLKVPAIKVEVFKSKEMYSTSRNWANYWEQHLRCEGPIGSQVLWYGSPELAQLANSSRFSPVEPGGLLAVTPLHGWSNISVPDKQTLVTDAGKLYVLDMLLTRLKEQGHRALIYSQMTRMIDLLEEYMWFRKHTYMRLDGSSKISDRRDMVADFQTRADIFVFLLSTRAGGLGINLTAADTVIFYDSDWNPTVDQQAMDRAHRLGQTKQVTVYRLICKGTIEERILQRAREKSEIQRMVISGGNFKPDTLKPKEVVSLLLDDAEIEKRYWQKQEERKQLEESRQDVRERERKRKLAINSKDASKQPKTEEVFLEMVNDDADVVVEETVETSDISEMPTIEKPQKTERVRPKRGRPPLRGGLTRQTIRRPNSSSGGIKRGPGRPRLKPQGPANMGTRGAKRGRGRGKKHLQAPINASLPQPFLQID